jgi:hypothetical protein
MAAKKEDVHVPPGEARCPGVSWNDLLGEDSRPVPDVLTREVYQYRGLRADRGEPLHGSGVLSRGAREDVASCLAMGGTRGRHARAGRHGRL